MSKHTPGPWETHNPSHIDLTICDMAGISAAVVWDKETDRDICYIPPRNSKHAASDCEEATANATLIAAAPDMLAALLGCIVSMESHANCNAFDSADDLVLRAARAAIAKAQPTSQA